MEVYGYLIDKVASDSIRIAFSFFHVGEVIREFDPRHFHDRLNKAQTIMSLTRGLAFKFPLPSSDPLSDRGFWFPEIKMPFELTAQGLSKEIAESLTEEMKNRHLSRHERRKILSRGNLHTLIENLPDNVDFSSLKRLALPKEMKDRNILKDLLLGKIGEEFVSTAFLKIFADLELLVGALDERERQISITAMVDDLFRKIDESLKLMESSLEFTQAQLKEARKREKEIRNLEKEVRLLTSANSASALRVRELRMQASDLRRNLNYFIENKQPEGYEFNSAGKLSPILEEVIQIYVKENVRSGRTRVPSDVVDIFHSAYLPFCDLWRGDRWFSNALTEAKVSGFEKIVVRITDLPDRIEQLGV